MDIRGYLPTSLLEWPGKISAVVFVPGCNFRCPFCYNRDLVLHPEKLPKIPEKDVFEDLKKRKKWIDGVALSIHGDEPVVIEKGGRLLHLPIKEIWSYGGKRSILRRPILHESRNIRGIKCLTGEDFRVASKIFRHKTKSLYKIVCGPGNYSVVATGSHSVFTVTKNGLVAQRVDKLKKGNWLLSPKKIKGGKNTKKISLLDYVPCLKENREIRQARINHWRKIASQIGFKSISQLSREYGHTRKTIREYYRSFKNNFSDLLDEWVSRIPLKIELSPELGEFLGYAVAEGSVRRKGKVISSYTFTLGDELKLAERILTLYRKIFSQNSGVINKTRAETGNWQYNVILGNRIIGELIGNLVGDGFINKHVPEIIFNAPTNVKINFIKALILGDGHERVRRTHSQHEFSLKTGSRRLAADFIFLLKTINVFSWIEEDKNSFRIVVSQNDLEKIGVGQELNLKYRFKTRIEGIPRELLGYALRGQKRVRQEKLAIWQALPIVRNKKLKAAAIRHGLLDKKGRVTEKGERLLSLLRLSKHWNFKEVKKVEKIELDKLEYVYDLVVENNHSFVGGIGSLLLHNTGGEPTLQEDLLRFLRKCKRMGFETMIETNGSKPEVLRLSIADCQLLIDFVAMDFKAPLDERYAKTVGLKNFNSTAIVKSIKLLLESEIPFELRTTVVPGIHDRKVLIEMAKQLKEIVSSIKYQVSSIRWFLQQFQPKNCLDPSFEKIKPYSKMEMEKFLKAVKKYIPETEIRGV